MKTKKRIGVIVAGVICAVGVMAGTSIYASAAIKVESYEVRKNNISSILELNGNVKAEKIQNSYSEVNAKVKTVHVKAGDAVKKGDLLVSFDEEQIDLMISLAQYEAQANLGGYDNAIEMGKRAQSLYNEATVNLKVLNQQIEDTEKALNNAQRALTNRKAELAGTGARLQVAMIDKAGNPESAAEYNSLQKEATNNAYEQEAGKDILALQEEINRLTNDLTHYKEYKSEMLSQKASADGGRMTSGQKNQLEAQKAANELSSEDTVKRLEKAKNGIRAPFDGIVTGLFVDDGCEVGSGMRILTLASTDAIVLECTANKYDIANIEKGMTASTQINEKEYTGKLTRIERSVEEGASGSGVNVEIRLDRPDDELILGLKAKAKIKVAAAEGVLSIPVDAIVEKDGVSYVFVARDKKAVLTRIETGIQNDDMIEVLAGLSEGSVVVWNNETELKDGMDIKGY